MPRFDAKSVELRGSNLIEASAGTGKTYSIALMAIRLVLEQNASINEILMVTFTKAAVAELELRVRAFIRMGLKVARGENIEDRTITELVNAQVAFLGREEAIRRMNDAQLLLDETSVLTIHSFCQKVLNEYAFETNHIFSAEAISPDEFNQMVEDSFNEYWRLHITTLDTRLLEELLEKEFSRDNILKVVKEGLSGKKPTSPNFDQTLFLSPSFQEHFLNKLSTSQDDIEKTKVRIRELVERDYNRIKLNVEGNNHARNAFLVSLEQRNWRNLIEKLIEKAEKIYVPRCFGAEIAEDIKALANHYLITANSYRELISQIGVHAFSKVAKDVNSRREDNGKINYDDMIMKLYKALERGVNRGKLIAAMRKKYKAAFIDEFQDTDKEQYLIFRTLFGEETILFYIGDPKQSIYGWRKADIDTYFKARRDVSNVYTMDVNFRSTESFINAMNSFFLPTPGFDTFAFNGMENAIDYEQVKSPSPNTKEAFLQQNMSPPSLLISEHGNKKDLKESVVNLVFGLLHSGDYKLKRNGLEHVVKPSDIGILVRTNKEGRAIKEMLAKVGIHSVNIDDSKVFASNEAKELYYIMTAVYDATRSNINRALLTRIGGYNIEELQRADTDAIMNRFRNYQETWRKEGVYVMLRKFLADHNLYKLFYSETVNSSERTVANVLQLVEIIHKESERKGYDPLEQLQWFKKGMDGDAREGDEFEQRIENDEESVKIVTIHKSKGLEYNIVIAPHLDMNVSNNHDTYGYRHPVTGEYLVTTKKMLTEDESKWYREQTEQENRRLLYVAVTRARYQCFITASLSNYNKSSCLRSFVDPVKQAIESGKPLDGIGFWDIPEPDNFDIKKPQVLQVREYAKADRFELTGLNWRKSSYTSLSPDHEATPIQKYLGLSKDMYDKFVFNELRKGAQTGNLLHYIFENISFNEPRYWRNVIERGIKRLSSPKSDAYVSNLESFLHQVMGVKLPIDGELSLSQISREDRLNELEFDFPLQSIKPGQIEALSAPDAPMFVRSSDELEGMMTGKMDLLFRHHNKYYILDWKSNYLGETLEDYRREKLQDAMDQNNYHLQYHIYTLAAIKYLSLRIPDFDYEQGFGGVIYLFVRGIRVGSDTGIYFRKPEKGLVEELAKQFQFNKAN
jgi:exodeoxyribonuclease V beta subunit